MSFVAADLNAESRINITVDDSTVIFFADIENELGIEPASVLEGSRKIELSIQRNDLTMSVQQNNVVFEAGGLGSDAITYVESRFQGMKSDVHSLHEAELQQALDNMLSSFTTATDIIRGN